MDMSNYIQDKECDVITHPCPNFNYNGGYVKRLDVVE